MIRLYCKNYLPIYIFMKKNHFIHLLIILLLVSCTHEPIDYGESSNFTIADAKDYFEDNATDLRNVSFNSEVISRSFERENVTPDWKSAKITQTGKIITVEIPLDGDVCKIARTSRMNGAKKLYGFATKVTTKLVVQRHAESGICRQFVVTLVDGLSQSFLKNETRNYCDKTNYSGYIIISAVTGEYLESFRSINGRWERVYMAPGTKEDLEDTRNASIHLLGADASSATYSFGEGGSERCPNCGNVLSMCTCCKNCGGKGCSECTVIVYPTCPKCHYTGPGATTGSCYCCPQCHNYPCTCRNVCPFCLSDPCVCALFSCPYCGSRYCNGSCQGGGGTTPDPDPDECHHAQCPVCHKMIRTQTRSLTRSSICDSHEYCENDGMCVDVQVSVSKNQITLGDSYTITLKLTPANTVCSDITYSIIENGKEFFLTQTEMSTSLTSMARTPGNFQVKAEIVQDGTYKTYTSKNNVIVTHVFPDRNEILRQQVVIDGMNNSWAQTLAATDATGMQEFGGVVVIDTREGNTGALYRYESCHGPKTPYTSSSVDIILEDINNYNGANRGGEYTVLFFHAHPPFWAYKQIDDTWYRRKVGPSEVDITNHKTVPAVVKDFWHATDTISTKMPRSEYENTARLYHYGVERKRH